MLSLNRTPEHINVGDYVQYRGSWGQDLPRMAKVTELELTDEPRSKHGRAVPRLVWELVSRNLVMFILDTLDTPCHCTWAYSDQIDGVFEETGEPGYLDLVLEGCQETAFAEKYAPGAEVTNVEHNGPYVYVEVTREGEHYSITITSEQWEGLKQ